MAIIVLSKGSGLSAAGDLHFEISSDLHDPSPSATDRRPGLLAGWSYKNHSLRLYTDRFGLLPLFYCRTESSITISDSIYEISSYHDVTVLDRDALSVFLRLGYYVGNDTPLEGIKVLPPSLDITLVSGDEAIDDVLHIVPAQSLRRDDAIDGYIELFQHSIRSRINHDTPIDLPISGGRDSRHILFELLRQNKPPRQLVTIRKMNPHAGEDIKIAGALAQRFNLPHKIIPQKFGGALTLELEASQRQFRLCDEGAWMLPLFASLTKDANVIMDGFAGDTLSNDGMYDEVTFNCLKNGQTEKAAHRILRGKAVLPFLADNLQTHFSYEQALERLTRELRRHTSAASPWKSYLFWNRTRREIALAPLLLSPSSLDIQFPYLHPDLVDFLLSLEGDEYGPAGLHDEVILKAYPEWADIPFESHGNAHGHKLFSSREIFRLFGVLSKSRLANKTFVLSRLVASALKGSHEDMSWWLSKTINLVGLEEENWGPSLIAQKTGDDDQT